MRSKISWPQCKEILLRGFKAKQDFQEPSDWQSKVMRRVRLSSGKYSAPESEMNQIGAFVYRLSFASLFMCVAMQTYNWSASEPEKSGSEQLEQLVPEFSAVNLLWENQQ